MATATLNPTRTPHPTPYDIYVLGLDETEVSFCQIDERTVNVCRIWRGRTQGPQFMTRERAREESRNLKSRGFEFLARSQF
jgi:hypothetical protein